MLPPNQSAHFSHKAPRPQALARHREWLPDFGPQRLMFASLYLSIRKFIRPTQRVNRWRGPPQTGEIGFRRPCSLSTILENMTEDEQQELLRTVAQTHASLSEVALKLRLELPPKAPALKTALKAEGGAFYLKCALRQLVVGDLEQANGRERLPEVRRGGKVVDVELRLRQSARRLCEATLPLQGSSSARPCHRRTFGRGSIGPWQNPTRHPCETTSWPWLCPARD